jgi:hypothetical protein
MVIALKRLNIISFVFTMSKFSHPSGNPTCFDGKLSVTSLICRPEETARERTELKRDAFFGVVNMVTIIPRCAKSLAMSTIGIMCP